MMSFGKDKLVATRDDAIEMEGKLQDRSPIWMILSQTTSTTF